MALAPLIATTIMTAVTTATATVIVTGAAIATTTMRLVVITMAAAAAVAVITARHPHQHTPMPMALVHQGVTRQPHPLCTRALRICVCAGCPSLPPKGTSWSSLLTYAYHPPCRHADP